MIIIQVLCIGRAFCAISPQRVAVELQIRLDGRFSLLMNNSGGIRVLMSGCLRTSALDIPTKCILRLNTYRYFVVRIGRI